MGITTLESKRDGHEEGGVGRKEERRETRTEILGSTCEKYYSRYKSVFYVKLKNNRVSGSLLSFRLVDIKTVLGV